MAFAGDVNFAERTADRLAADPATAFGAAAAELGSADFTVVNLETAITDRGEPAPKQFHFRAPATALEALSAAGVDAVSLANNHAADYGEVGVGDTLAAIADTDLPVIGFGSTAAEAFAPTMFSGGEQSIALFAATLVPDWTKATWPAADDSPGIAAADDPRLLLGVRAAAAAGHVPVVYLHWGTEYQPCPDGDQRHFADLLAKAGAAAIVGTHAHVLQGFGWRGDGVYVAYGLGNYLWWRSFGNTQDDNGILTLTFRAGSVIGSTFQPAHLDDTGVPVPATGAERDRIRTQVEQARGCADLASVPPG